MSWPGTRSERGSKRLRRAAMRGASDRHQRQAGRASDCSSMATATACFSATSTREPTSPIGGVEWLDQHARGVALRINQPIPDIGGGPAAQARRQPAPHRPHVAAWSFSPLGSSTSGTMYVAAPQGPQTGDPPVRRHRTHATADLQQRRPTLELRQGEGRRHKAQGTRQNADGCRVLPSALCLLPSALCLLHHG